MTKSRYKPCLSLALALVLCVSTFGRVLAATETDADLAIQSAESRIVICYQAATAAEQAGANVSSLLVILNEAGELLSRAHLAYDYGDFDSARTFALQGEEMLNGFDNEAESLKQMAIQAHYWDYIVNVIGSLVGSVLVIYCGLIVWFVFERRDEKLGSMIK